MDIESRLHTTIQDFLLSSRNASSDDISLFKSQLRQSSATFKAIREKHWPETPLSEFPVSPLSTPPLQLVVPQSFFTELDHLQVSSNLREEILCQLQTLQTSYANNFRAICSRLVSSATYPSLRSALPSTIEKLRRLVQNRFEHEGLSWILHQLKSLQQQASADIEEKRPRSFNHAYTPVLEKYFELNVKPSAADQEALAKKSGMSKRQIEVWFQNRRRRCKQKHGENHVEKKCTGFAEENIQKLREGLPEYLLQKDVPANAVDLVEQVVDAEREVEMRDLRPDRKHASLHAPRYPRTDAPNPLNPSPAPAPQPFNPRELPESQQFAKRTDRPHFDEPQWERRPYVPALTVPPQVKKPRGKAAQIAKANPAPPPPSPMDELIRQFKHDFYVDNRYVPDEYLTHYWSRGPKLADAATYAKTVRPPTGRHPAFIVPGSKPIPSGIPAYLASTSTPSRSRRKHAGLPKRTPKHPYRRPARQGSSSPSSGSRSPSPHSRTPSLASSTSSSGSSLRRHSSVSSLSSDPDSPLYSPVSLPSDLPNPSVAVAGTDFSLDTDHLALPPRMGKNDMQINFPAGFDSLFDEQAFSFSFGFPAAG